MMGGFINRGLVLIFGYAYPAYECFKTVEKNKPEIETLRIWCQYWILVATIALFESVTDFFLSWLPFYGEAKLAFIIYLWHPNTKGSRFFYDAFFKPYISKHEPEIDRCLLELKTRAGDMAYTYFQKFAGYGQTRFFEILQLVTTQSIPRPRPPQAQQPAPRPTSSSTSSYKSKQTESWVNSSASTPIRHKKSVSLPADPESAASGEETIGSVSARAEKFAKKPTSQDETVMEETIRLTQGRLRKTRTNSIQE